MKETLFLILEIIVLDALLNHLMIVGLMDYALEMTIILEKTLVKEMVTMITKQNYNLMVQLKL